MKINRLTIMALAGLLFGVAGASAHITLDTREATIGTSHKIVLRISHGCAGEATTRLRIQIPQGVIEVKPQPKAGWELAKVRGAYARSHDYHGTPVSEGVTEVSWSGNLPDDEYDEFALRVFLSADLEPGTMLYFPTVQDCAEGNIARWIEIPEAGKSADDHEHPAPGLKLLPKP